jgi:hypothetical protein
VLNYVQCFRTVIAYLQDNGNASVSNVESMMQKLGIIEVCRLITVSLSITPAAGFVTSEVNQRKYERRSCIISVPTIVKR